MFIDTTASDSFRRGLLHELVAPRPVGWISTISAAGEANLAPFSHFMVVSTAPPVVLFACNTPTDRAHKDSLANAEATGEFAVNFASYDLRHKMVESSATPPHGVDEFALAGLEKAQCLSIRPPRVAAAPATLECKVTQVLRIAAESPTDGDSHVVFGRVVGIHMRDALVSADGRFDTIAAGPVARLGGRSYLTATETFELTPRFTAR